MTSNESALLAAGAVPIGQAALVGRPVRPYEETMLDVVAISLGAVLVVLAYLDALATTVVVREGAGPLTRRLTAAPWHAALRLRRQGDGSRTLALGGGALLFTTILSWVALLWAGWTLIFLGGDPAVVQSSTRSPAGWADVAYFAGFTLFTLGVGDFVATTQPWRLVTALASFSGLFLITLAITYLVSVVSAVVARRALAVHIRGLGATADEIALRGWDGEQFTSTYLQQLVTLGSEVATVAEQHLAYPILHSFHSAARVTSAPLALADLDDAVQLLTVGVTPRARPDPSATLALAHALERYITTASVTSAARQRQDPPPLGLAELRDGRVPVVDDETFHAALDSQRREAMARLVVGAGWTWAPGR